MSRSIRQLQRKNFNFRVFGLQLISGVKLIFLLLNIKRVFHLEKPRLQFFSKVDLDYLENLFPTQKTFVVFLHRIDRTLNTDPPVPAVQNHSVRRLSKTDIARGPILTDSDISQVLNLFLRILRVATCRSPDIVFLPKGNKILLIFSSNQFSLQNFTCSPHGRSTHRLGRLQNQWDSFYGPLSYF